MPPRPLHGCWDSPELSSASHGRTAVDRPPRVAAHLCLLFSCEEIIREKPGAVKLPGPRLTFRREKHKIKL